MTDPFPRHRHNFSLTYLGHFKIKNEKEGLNEPSGLALSHEKDELWTISDDTNKIFCLTLQGKYRKSKSFKIEESGLEGIVLHPSGQFIYAVNEENNSIVQINIKEKKVIRTQSLAEMSGYGDIANHFISGRTNKGLEGIAWNSNTRSIFVMKESDPGLLVELSPDLQTINNHRLLNEENGFIHSDGGSEPIDFSDICYDAIRDCFWVISDQARKLFLYDWKINRVLQSAKLGYGKNREYREIKKAEGVTVNSGINRLYVVSDEEARLYVFDIRD